MICTYYSNSFEVLSTILCHKIKFNIEDLRRQKKSVFAPIEVMVPSPYAGDRLNRLMADEFTITPGVRFTNVAGWMFSVLGRSLSNEVISDEIDWLLFSILSKKKEQNVVPPEQERLYDYLRTLNSVGVLEFARHINNVFVTYGSYRYDWLQEWAAEKYSFLKGRLPAPRYKFELPQLEQNPDFLWQKELWKELIERSQEVANNGDANGPKAGALLGWIEDTIQRVRSFDASTIQMPMHLFMPFSLPPSLLPLIKAFEKPEVSAELNIYLLNPCSEYWFESFPIKKFDWDKDSIENSQSTAPLAYLRTNEAGTRATIDRLDNFLFSEEEAAAFEAEQTEEQLNHLRNAPVSETGRRQFVTEAKNVQEKAQAEVEAAYLQFSDKPFLHKFQNSILRLNSDLLPEEPDKKDVSLRILKAPSFQREVEATIDILHNWFADPERDIGPSDVLVVVPDIDKASPVIEGVMTSLPSQKDLNLYIPWKIIGRSEANQNLLANAFIGLGKLLLSDFTVTEFLSWLEKPPVQLQWGFSLDDLSLIRTWLLTAGYVQGLDIEQLKERGLEHEDTSLQNAMERLTLGFLMDPDSPLPVKEVIPIRGTEDAGFDSVFDEGGRVFHALSALYQALYLTRKELTAKEFALPTGEWEGYIQVLKNRFFGNFRNPDESLRFDSVVSRLCGSLENTLGAGNDKKMHLNVLLNELESDLAKIKDRSTPTGALTFAPIGQTRGLPFKVICCLGFDEHCGFPGTPKFEEFDLMKTVHRRGDRDARLDNNAVFVDTLLSAREHLIISYTVGTKPQSENNPSIVIENFKTYFLSHARECQDGWKNSQKLWESIVSRVPLNRFSTFNFRDDPEKNLFWKSPRKDVLNVLNEIRGHELARADGKEAGSSVFKFADTSIPLEKLPKTLQDPDRHELPLNFLITFLTSFNDWGEMILKLSSSDIDTKEAEIVPDEEDHLLFAQLHQNVLELLRKGVPETEIVELGQLNPKYGLPSVRKVLLKGTVGEIAWAFERYKEMLQLVSGPESRELHFSLKGEKRLTLVESISDKLDDFYQYKKDGSSASYPVRFEFCSSKTSLRRAFLRQLFWCTGGSPYALVVLATRTAATVIGSGEVCAEAELAQKEEAVEMFFSSNPPARELSLELLRLFEVNRKYAIGMSTCNTSVLRTEIDESAIEELMGTYKTFKSNLLEKYFKFVYLNDRSLSKKKPKYEKGLEDTLGQIKKAISIVSNIQSTGFTAK